MNELVFKMSIVVPSDQSYLGWTKDISSSFLSNPASPASQKKGLSHKLTLATIEAVTNAIVHGNKYGQSPVVEIEMTMTEKWVEIKVRDTGPGYDLYKVPDPEIESCPTNGMGLAMIREIMTSVSLSKRDGKNELKMTKVF
ncbi:MAG: ATP-binding protein [Candidatus Glassbacteria bacterium]